MKNETKFLIIKIILFLNYISISFSQLNIIKNKFENITQNYYTIPSELKNIDIAVDQYFFGNINNINSTIYYNLFLLNDTEQIFFDFQSEFGCIYINIENGILKSNDNHFTFCSEGSSNIFILNKDDILEIIEMKEKDSIKNLSIIIGVGYSPLEQKNDFNFDYSLKVSLRKPEINIFEINSNNKTLCKTEKTENNNYRCLFIITNIDEKDNNLIVYSISQNKIDKLNIFADYINKDEYYKWNTEYLVNNIPNITSNYYNNSYNEMDFIYIPNYDINKFIYVSVESTNEETIEIIAQTISKTEEFELPKINDIKIYSINNTSAYFDFNQILMNDITLTLVTLYGKANIQLEYDKSSQYITDILENKLLFRINLYSCRNNNNCNLIINNLEENDKEGLGYIFYISYSKQSNNILNELTYSKSSKLLFNNNNSLIYPVILYEKISNDSSPININLQIYNLLQIDLLIESIFDIDVLITSKKDIYNFKLNYSEIDNCNNKIKGKFDSILSAANIYLTTEEINSFDIEYDKYLLIYISININTNIDITKLIIGSTVSQVNNLMYPSERIYHYGKLNNEERIVYKLKGNEKYHLMRLEFGCNSDNINWSVKRSNNINNYKENDTDLSFVTEKWSNGRELLTMYIEKGEDIYLTIYNIKTKKNKKLENYIFKYINSAKNGDFKNFIIKDDSLNYDLDSAIIDVNKLKNIPNFNEIKYFLKIIKENEYIENEKINTIAIGASKSYLTLFMGHSDSNNKISFNLKDYLNKKQTYYINVYSTIIENYSDIEYLSYSSFIIEGLKIEDSNIALIIVTFVIASFIVIMIIIRLIRYCIKEKNKRRYNYNYNYNYNNNYDDLLD